MILINVVFSGLAVYWFALARCLKFILNKLRKTIFLFLWGNTDGHQKYHLASWESVSVPIEYGGWNIKHLEWFGISLRLNNLWQLLMGNGIWSRIISHKYLKHKPLEVWIRAHKFNISGTSYFWNGFFRILSRITGHLGWKVGNG